MDTQNQKADDAAVARSRATASVRGTQQAAAYQLKVVLRGSTPQVWRRVLVDGQLTLADLHDVLQAVMGWEDAHLHCFRIGDRTYGVPSPNDWTLIRDERKAKLAQVAPRRDESLTYEYDFGDSWLHDLIVEDITRDAETAVLPVCLGGAHACPREDSGGIAGYQEMLAVLANPRHRAHREIAEWLGGFDPKAFDLAAVNERLASLRRGR